MKNLWINKEGQLRSGWKVLTLTVIAVILIVGFSFLLDTIGVRDKYGVSVFSGFILSVLIMLRFIDRKRLAYLGLANFKSGIMLSISGIFAGAFFIILNVLILQLSDLVTFQTNIFSPVLSPSLIAGLLLFILVGFAEELFFRAYIIQSFQQMGKGWLSILLSALIFSLSHGALNDNITPLAIVNLLGGGILMGYMFLTTKSLYLPIGFHIGWNYFQGYIFGTEVSGRNMGEALYTLRLDDHFMCGGEFGMEGGAANTFVIILAFFFVYFVQIHQRNIEKLFRESL